MSLPLGLWLRRCTSARAFPALLAIVLVIAHTRKGWEYEWDWAFNNVSTSTILLAPVVAGLVAFDRSRRMQPTLAELACTTARGKRSLMSMALASWLWHLAAWALVMLYAGIRVASHGAVGTPDVWVFAETPAVLLAGAFVGLLCGSVLPNLAAGPVAAVTTYAVELLGDTSGLSGLFMAGGSTGTLVGLERTPSVALATIGVHLGVALTCGLAAAAWTVAPERAVRWFAAAASLLVVGALWNLGYVERGNDAYRVARSATFCVGSGVVVCGPQKAGPLLSIAQKSVAEAVAGTHSGGIPWQTRYVLSRDDERIPSDSGVLRLSSDEIAHGRLSVGDIAGTLATPRMCQAYLEYEAPEQLLESQATVMGWVTEQLDADREGGAAPTGVRAAFERLSDCAPAVAASP